jgi:hypothetical protein
MTCDTIKNSTGRGEAGIALLLGSRDHQFKSGRPDFAGMV